MIDPWRAGGALGLGWAIGSEAALSHYLLFVGVLVLEEIWGLGVSFLFFVNLSLFYFCFVLFSSSRFTSLKYLLWK